MSSRSAALTARDGSALLAQREDLLPSRFGWLIRFSSAGAERRLGDVQLLGWVTLSQPTLGAGRSVYGQATDHAALPGGLEFSSRMAQYAGRAQ